MIILIVLLILLFIFIITIQNDSDNFTELDEFEDLPNVKIAIIMATFFRTTNKTIPYLKRSIESIINQEHKYWDLIIVGDKFEPESLLINLINEYNNKLENNKIIYIDNQIVERDYIKNKKNLWTCAGATSINKGLKYARDNNYKYYCHLDDDDYWSSKHLLYIAKIYKMYPNCVFTNTKSTHLTNYLPTEDIELYENNRLPLSGNTVHSSYSFRIDILPFYYETILNETDILKKPSDALMLDSIKDFIIDNKKYSSVYISKLTCYHDIEGELV